MLAFSRVIGGSLLAIAAVIAFSRVAMGLHYPGDVLAGAAVGTAAALLVLGPGAPWVSRVVSLASRVSDPVVEQLRRALPSRVR